MKLRSPIHSIDARGRFADALVFGIWRGINWAREFVIPTNPQTLRQDIVRQNLVTVARNWRTLLTSVQRQAWEDFATLMSDSDPQTANAIRMTGLDAYIWVNTVMLDAALPAAADPPALPMPVALPGFTVAPGPGAGEVTATWTPLAVGHMVNLWSQQIPVSRRVMKNRYKHRIYLDGALGTYTFTGCRTGWTFAARGREIRPDGGRGSFARGDVLVP